MHFKYFLIVEAIFLVFYTPRFQPGKLVKHMTWMVATQSPLCNPQRHMHGDVYVYVWIEWLICLSQEIFLQQHTNKPSWTSVYSNKLQRASSVTNGQRFAMGLLGRSNCMQQEHVESA